MDKTEYLKAEKSQRLHRMLNTTLAICVLVVSTLMIRPVIHQTNEIYEDLSGITQQKIVRSEIAQIAADEGYSRCVYKDSLGLKTIGFGTLVEHVDSPDCIGSLRAVELLREHYTVAQTSVEKRYPWADGETKLVLINISYNMGETRLAKFSKMLSYLKECKYDLAASELLDSRYATQVPLRAGRMAGRVMGINSE